MIYTLKKTVVTALAAACVLSLGLSGCRSALPETGADVVFLNGEINTQNPDQTWVEAIAIDGKRISYVGDNQQAQMLIGQNTQVIDLKGQLVLPGFIDTHAHPILAAGMAHALQLDLEAKPEDWLKALLEYAEDNPDLPGLMGFGFSAEAFGAKGPTKELLDAVIPDRPVILIDEGGHSAWVNSKALALAGINHKTPDPVPGTHYFKRAADGEPTGWCLEAMTFNPMIAKLGLISKESIIEQANDIFYLFSAFGITTIYDAGFSAFSDMAYEAVGQLEQDDKLASRLITSHMIQSPKQLADAVATLQSYQQRFGSELVQPRVMKIHNDGTKEARTAGLFDAYEKQPENFGSLLLEGEQLQSFVKEVDEAGFDIHIHAIGDRTVHEALNAFEQVRGSNPESNNRYSIAHTELVSDDDLGRFSELAVVAQTTPFWFPSHGEEQLGKVRAEKLYRFRKMLDSGAKVTFGSDFPATGDLLGLSPIVNMEMGQTRQFPSEGTPMLSAGVDGSLTLQEMIRGYTIDAAYQLNLEDELGSLEVGKLADLVVIDENIFEQDIDNIHQAKVAMTFMNGERVYERNLKSHLTEWVLGL